MDRTLATVGSGSSRGFLYEAQGRPGPRRQGQVGDQHRLWSTRPRVRYSLTPGGITGGVLKGWLMNLGQDQGAAPQTCSARSKFAGRFPANSESVLPKPGSVWAERS